MPGSPPYRVAFIGTGGRSVSYAKEYAHHDQIQVVALADPQPQNRLAMAHRAQLRPGYTQHDDWRHMLDQHRQLDGVVISSPNWAHTDQAVACLERGIAVALEKPIAHTKEDCETILDAERTHNGRTLVGFVLRSAPFYLKAYELVRSGAIGQIVSIEAHELVRWLVTALIMRGSWRRHTDTSGGSMLEKCCHDLDIINWLMGCRPISLNSYGGRLMFNPNPALPLYCKDCGVAKTCKYYSVPKHSAREDQGEKTLHDFMADEGRCIYNIDKDIADVQNVNIEYENGAIASLLMNFHVSGSRGSRNLSINGTRGCIWGDIDDLKIRCYLNDTDEETEYSTKTDGSGHGGGDRRHSLELLHMMQDPSYRPDQNAQAGYLGCAMALACDVSRVERRRVDLRYNAHGRVEFA